MDLEKKLGIPLTCACVMLKDVHCDTAVVRLNAGIGIFDLFSSQFPYIKAEVFTRGRFNKAFLREYVLKLIPLTK